jgi:putative transposase
VPAPRNRSSIPAIKPFGSALIPKYMTKSLNIEEAHPYFYLGGLSNSDLIPAFEGLFGEQGFRQPRSLNKTDMACGVNMK